MVVEYANGILVLRNVRIRHAKMDGLRLMLIAINFFQDVWRMEWDVFKWNFFVNNIEGLLVPVLLSKEKMETVREKRQTKLMIAKPSYVKMLLQIWILINYVQIFNKDVKLQAEVVQWYFPFVVNKKGH